MSIVTENKDRIIKDFEEYLGGCKKLRESEDYHDIEHFGEKYGCNICGNCTFNESLKECLDHIKTL